MSQRLHPYITASIYPVLFLILSSGVASAGGALQNAEQLYHSRRYPAAEKEFKQAIRQGDHGADLYYHLGLVQLQQKEPEALQSLEKAVQVDHSIVSRTNIQEMIQQAQGLSATVGQGPGSHQPGSVPPAGTAPPKEASSPAQPSHTVDWIIAILLILIVFAYLRHRDARLKQRILG